MLETLKALLRQPRSLPAAALPDPERVTAIEPIEAQEADMPSVPPVDELLFHGTRADLASLATARGTLQPRHDKPLYFADDARYAGGHSGDKSLVTATERLSSQQSSRVFVVRRADLQAPNGTIYTFSTRQEVPIIGSVPSAVAFQGNEAVRQHLIDNPELLHSGKPQLLPLTEAAAEAPQRPATSIPVRDFDALS
jgi:hypothetical protein